MAVWRERLTIGFAAACLVLAAIATFRDVFPGPAGSGPLTLTRVGFDALVGFDDDALEEAWPALLRSCRAREGKEDDARLGGRYGGTWGDWREACARAEALAAAPREELRAFLKSAFVPVRIAAGEDPVGLFTGYYEPELAASRAREGAYQTPIYARPADLVTIDLGLFKDDWRGETVSGRLTGSTIVPYPPRADIVAAEEAAIGTPIAYLADPVDAFFLQIQGSGRLKLPDGSLLAVGYAAQNGHPYTAIGKPLIERGAIPREEMSMQRIHEWLNANPGERDAVMNLNESYVFFREIELPDPALGAFGAQGVQLTPGRSLAVDRRLHPYGLLLWLDATRPSENGDQPFRRLMVAQDTGGAIRGPVRGDVYWGHGEEAAAIAGPMKAEGRLYALVPVAVAATLPREP
ncbi:MAG: murein transglycosylase [Alphaproteobacteria bacterium]|nr:murein transglycosylase [Alphaproteobacteria bacterium]